MIFSIVTLIFYRYNNKQLELAIIILYRYFILPTYLNFTKMLVQKKEISLNYYIILL